MALIPLIGSSFVRLVFKIQLEGVLTTAAKSRQSPFNATISLGSGQSALTTYCQFFIRFSGRKLDDGFYLRHSLIVKNIKKPRKELMIPFYRTCITNNDRGEKKVFRIK
jgi:hypothetical protein